MSGLLEWDCQSFDIIIGLWCVRATISLWPRGSAGWSSRPRPCGRRKPEGSCGDTLLSQLSLACLYYPDPQRRKPFILVFAVVAGTLAIWAWPQLLLVRDPSAHAENRVRVALRPHPLHVASCDPPPTTRNLTAQNKAQINLK